MINIPATFTLILSGLRAAVGAFMARRDQPTRAVWLGTQLFVSVSAPPTRAERINAAITAETWTLLWTRLGRAAARFQTLFDRWRTNTLPKPSPARPGCPTRPASPRPASPRLPTRQAWVIAAVGHEAAGRASQLNTLMAEPDFTAFVTAVPRAGRILRPLCRMLGITPLPPPLRLPAKPRPPRPTRTRPPREPKLRPADLRRPRLPPPFIILRKNTP